MTQDDAQAETQTPKLLDCPFCGSTAELMCTQEDDNDRAPRPHYVFIVECTTCEVRMSETSTRWFDGGAPALDAADLKAEATVIAKWNRRDGVAQGSQGA